MGFIGGIFWTDCDYDFNLCSIFEKMTSFFQILHQDLEQGKLMGFIDSYVIIASYIIHWNLARYLGKAYMYCALQKCKNMDIESLIIGAL